MGRQSRDGPTGPEGARAPRVPGRFPQDSARPESATARGTTATAGRASGLPVGSQVQVLQSGLHRGGQPVYEVLSAVPHRPRPRTAVPHPARGLRGAPAITVRHRQAGPDRPEVPCAPRNLRLSQLRDSTTPVTVPEQAGTPRARASDLPVDSQVRLAPDAQRVWAPAMREAAEMPAALRRQGKPGVPRARAEPGSRALPDVQTPAEAASPGVQAGPPGPEIPEEPPASAVAASAATWVVPAAWEVPARPEAQGALVGPEALV